MKKANENTESLSHFSAQNPITSKNDLIDAYKKITIESNRNHGFRTEYMFGYVAGALGKCTVVKHEHAAGLILSN
jgi:hypothetical protein